MRATMHNGRAGKSGVFLASHNDRDFDTKNAEHIDDDRTVNNWTWTRYANKGITNFEEAEKKFYEDNFSKSLDAQNDKHRKSRHAERVKSMDDYRKGKQTCPEETIMQIGKAGETIDPKLLQQIVVAQINWEQKQFPNVKVLDVALHVDEEGAPHIHKRQVWTANSDSGLVVSQNKALAEMGIERPDTSKTENRYNNAKMTYTKQCREHFLELCKEKGLDIETEPKDASETGLSLTEYKRRQEEARLRQAKAELQWTEDEQKKAIEQANAIIQDRQDKAMEDMKGIMAEQQKKLNSRKQELDSREGKINARDAAQNRRENALNEKSRELYAKEEKALKMANTASQEHEDNKTEQERLERWAKELNARQGELDGREQLLGNREKRIARREREALDSLKSTAAYLTEENNKRLQEAETIEDFCEGVKSLDSNSGLSL
jgi:hypothetical protein